MDLTIKYVFVLRLLQSSDVEVNPGPERHRPRSCCILYANVSDMHSNLHDLSVASLGYDIIMCSETLVSDRRHVSQLLASLVSIGLCKSVSVSGLGPVG